MRLAIIGAGVAGLAAARAVQSHRPDWHVAVYEKSRGFGGRVATRRREGYAFDHGAQVIKGPTEAVEALLTQELSTTDLRRMELPTWSFDGMGTIREGDPQQNAEASYFYASGNNQIGKLLAEGINVRREVRVGALRRPTTDERRPTTEKQEDQEQAVQNQTGWTLIDTNEQPVGEADAVLLTPPAPQVVDILCASELDQAVRDLLVAELNKATYRHCLSLALAYDRLIARPFYALVNNDRKHPMAWLALEHAKGETRCPDRHSLLIAQMASQWSADHYTATVEELTPQIAELVGMVLGEDVQAPLWSDLQRWRYSQPDGGANSDVLHESGAPHGLFFAGDYAAGKGRVHLAIEQGWKVAERIVSREY